MKRPAAAASALLLAAALAGCGVAGEVNSRNASQKSYTAENGRNATAGDLELRNVLVIRGEGTAATVLAGFRSLADADDQLVSVQVGDQIARGDGPVEIPANGYSSVGLRDDDPTVVVTAVDTEPGRLVDVKFTFASAPSTTVTTLVLAAQGIYAESGPPPLLP